MTYHRRQRTTRTDLIDKGPVNISKAARASSVSAETIRYYESTGLLPPSSRTEGSYRMCDVWALHVLCFIHRSCSLGFTLEKIRTLLSLWNDHERASTDVKAVTLRRMTGLDACISELQIMRDTLMTLANAHHGDDRSDYPILQGVAGEGGEGGPESDLDIYCHRWVALLAQIAIDDAYATIWQPEEETPIT